MKCTRPLVAVALVTASLQTVGAETTTTYPTHGAYWLLELSPVSNLAANWPCQVSTSKLCTTPTRIDYRSTKPNFAVGFGYTFNRYIAIEAGGGLLFGGSNTRDETYMNDSVEFDAATIVDLTVRGDLPITRHIALYGNYGLGYQSARMTYNEQDYGSEYGTGDPTNDFHKSFDGSFRTMSVGFNFQFGEGVSYRLGYTRHTSIDTFSYSAITLGMDMALLSTWR